MNEDAGCAKRVLCALFATVVKLISHLRLPVCGLFALLFALSGLAEAQQPEKVHRIGYLSPVSSSRDSTRRDGFLQGLRQHGYIQGQNLVIEYRFADGDLDRQDALAAELVRLNVDLMLAGGGTPTARAAKNATHTIPIVMTNAADPVADGLIASLAHPGGNITGLTAVTPDLSAKRLELLKETVPNVSRVAALWNPVVHERATDFKEAQAAAEVFHIQLQSLEVRDADHFERAFVAATKERAQALIILPDPLTNTHQARIVDFAVRKRLPTMFSQRPPVDAGGLMSYSPNYEALFRRAATYVDKILKGAKPADLPVEQPTKFELVINLKTAKQIGLTIPQWVLMRADKIIK
jgi:putative ABC transport system substrate-binding protein